MPKNNRITLTAEQQYSADRLSASISDSRIKTVLIEGGAGTGKTTTLGCALRQMSTTDGLLCAAPTHRAAAQFRHSLERENVNAEVSTVHSLLKVRMKRSEETGLLVNDPAVNFWIPPTTRAVLIDEISMVPDWMLWRLQKAVGSDTTIIGIGDRAQLPPVGGRMNFLFDSADETLGLTRVMRHQGPILRLSDSIRRAELDIPEIRTDTAGESSVQLCKGYHFKREWETALRWAAREGTQEQLRLLSYTRSDVDSWAWASREIFHRLDDRFESWIPHERLTNVDSLMSRDEEVLLPPSSEVEMIEAGDTRPAEGLFMHPDWGKPYKVQTCKFKEVHSEEHYEADVVVPDDAVRFKAHQKEMMSYIKDPKNADAEDLKEVGNAYTDRALGLCCLQPIHATTIHKSQGSTFDTVFVNLDDCRWHRTKGRLDAETLNKLAYVGVSRAAKRVVVNWSNAPV